MEKLTIKNKITDWLTPIWLFAEKQRARKNLIKIIKGVIMDDVFTINSKEN